MLIDKCIYLENEFLEYYVITHTHTHKHTHIICFHCSDRDSQLPYNIYYL